MSIPLSHCQPRLAVGARKGSPDPRRWTLVRFPRVWLQRVQIPASLLLYALLAILVFWSAWRMPSIMSIGFGPDPRLFMWDLGWTPFAASHGHNPLVTNYLDYPGGMNLLWSNSGPLVTALLWPLSAARGVIVAD